MRRVLGLICAAWLLAGSSPEASAESIPGPVLIAGGTLALGSDMKEIIHVAEECARRAEDSKTESCSPENFTNELGAGAPERVESFLLDRLEVSVGKYAHCVRAGRCRAVDDPRRVEAFLDPRLPMVFVTQEEAAAYCRFQHARLPTEAEWEYAARGTAGRRYPWGSTFHSGLANAGRNGARVTDVRDGFEMLAPTTSFADGGNPAGALQLSGNVAEWTSTPFSPHARRDAENLGKKHADFVVKGGSFILAPSHLRGAARKSVEAGTRAPDIGFRCARDVIPTSSSGS